MATKNWPSREALELGNRASASRHMLEKCASGYWTKGNNFEREILTFNTAYQVCTNDKAHDGVTYDALRENLDGVYNL